MTSSVAPTQPTGSWKRPFYTLWAGQAFSILTSAIVSWAIIFYLTYQTGSGAVLSISSLMSFLPQALLGPIAGPVVDRLPRKFVLIGADGCVALSTLVLVLAAQMDVLSLPLIYAMLFLRAAFGAFHEPTISAVTPQLVPAENLMEVGGYTQAIQSMGYIAGTVGAAMLYPIWPFELILALDVLGAAIAIVGVCMVPIPPVAHAQAGKLPKPAEIVQENLESWRVFKSVPGFPTLMLAGFVFMVAFSPLIALYPLMTMQYFGGTEFMTSLVELALAGGMMLGGIVIGRFFSHVNRGHMILASIFLIGAITVAMGILPASWFGVFVMLNVLAGLCEAAFNTPFSALIQERIPQSHLGRVFSLFQTVMMFATPLGLVFSGMFSDNLGIVSFFIVCGVVITIDGIVACFSPKLRHIESARMDQVLFDELTQTAPDSPQAANPAADKNEEAASSTATA